MGLLSSLLAQAASRIGSNNNMPANFAEVPKRNSFVQPARLLQRFRAKWIAVRGKKTRQNKNPELRLRFNQNRSCSRLAGGEMEFASCLSGWSRRLFLPRTGIRLARKRYQQHQPTAIGEAMTHGSGRIPAG